MRRQLFGIVVLVVSMLTAICVTQAVSFGGPPDDGSAVSVERQVLRMTKALGLSDTQREQITALLQAERAKNAPLREQLMAGRTQLRQATLAAAFDEAAVQALANSQAQILSQLIVSRARTKNQINALLTPEQRSQAEKMAPMGKRHHRRPGGPESDF